MGSPWAWPRQPGGRAGLHPSRGLQRRLCARSLTPAADTAARQRLRGGTRARAVVPRLPWASAGRGPSPRSSSGSVSRRPVSRPQSLQQTPSPNSVQMGHQKSYNIFFPFSHSHFLPETRPHCAALFLSLSLSVSLSFHLFVSLCLSLRLSAISSCLSPLSLCPHVYFSAPLPLSVPSCLVCCLHLSVSLTSICLWAVAPLSLHLWSPRTFLHLSGPPWAILHYPAGRTGCQASRGNAVAMGLSSFPSLCTESRPWRRTRGPSAAPRALTFRHQGVRGKRRLGIKGL